MGRVGGRTARVQVTSRLTWTFSARAALGRTRPGRPGRSTVAQRLASLALLRSVVRAGRARTLPAARRRHALRR
ncbi:hypothetical protein [Streptomyces sp. NPDC057616]|uniref:hypothetical protein n=1 Tax=Streptomyces sp. NPDC057616 TaxID=3346183 RepID=UPI00368A66D2